MPIDGVPDFAQPLVEEGMTIFYPLREGGCTLCPDGLEIAASTDGIPAFSLELVRGASDYGVLDLALAARFSMDPALSLVRRKRAHASLRRAQFTAALFRWRPRLDSEMPAGFLEPQALSWNGLGAYRVILKLSRDAAVLIRHALSDETFLLDATVDVELEGIAPRVPVRARFDSNELLAELRRGGTVLAQSDVIRLFQEDSRLPVRIEGTLSSELRGDFAEAMTDRIRARFGQFAAAPPEDASPHFAIPATGDPGLSRFDWDLSQPVVVKRGLTLRMHALDLVRDFIARSGNLDAVCRTTVSPPLPVGQHVVSLFFNLARGRAVNLVAAGATLTVPPAPPFRFQTATGSADVRPPDSSATARLKLSPVEKLAYKCATWAAISSSRGVVRYEAERFDGADEVLTLGPSELPYRLISIEVDRSLLDLASVGGTLVWDEADQTCTVTFSVDTQESAVELAVPRLALNARVEITALETAGSGLLKLPPTGSEAVHIGLYSFREYGPQQVVLTQLIAEGAPSQIVEVLPEGEPESASLPVLLTSQEPTKTCSYFAASPFHGGFRFRVRQSFGAPPGPWSILRQPFDQLVIPASSGS